MNWMQGFVAIVLFVLMYSLTLIRCSPMPREPDQIYQEDAASLNLSWDKFCESRGGMHVKRSLKYGSSYFCMNGEHTHFDKD